ncbi:hypothetical protein AKJ09_09122 [Labilithrix luteola]|uniref:Uncharacterized protein n=1 Tax=Labilithrix luteola TaxID=1391654 RepID=A0A0K1Q9P5_9BACT|nr:hypothetical protein [Labilithrix luteola]AKV02459.1 hypothetical protein AKJ09_09122 [Labilithrix luteola]
MENLHHIRSHLLDLHHAMVQEERRVYEDAHGKVSAGQFLGALVNDEAFAWLRPMTALIVELDENEANGTVDGDAWLAQVRGLLSPNAEGTDFQRHYEALLQRSPDVGLAHGATMRALRS